jgi:Uma2 family endonuclease
MTEREFVDWCDGDTWAEWVDGEVKLMNAVSADHSDAAFSLIHLIRGYLDEHDLGRLLGEPFQIRFAKLRRRRSPDLIFISNEQLKALERNVFDGAPDLIVEVVSPESQSRDRREKYLEYEAAGVKEYWIVDTLSRSFEMHVLGKNGKYSPIPQDEGIVHSTVLRGFFIRPIWFWQPKFPKVSTLLKEMARKR